MKEKLKKIFALVLAFILSFIPVVNIKKAATKEAVNGYPAFTTKQVEELRDR